VFGVLAPDGFRHRLCKLDDHVTVRSGMVGLETHPFFTGRRIALIWLSILPLLGARSVGAMAAMSEVDPLLAAAETLARVKSSAEDRVRLLHGRFSDGALGDKDLLEAERYYAAAQADVNAGIEQILSELLGRGHPGSEAAYVEMARRAGDAAGRFIRFADGLLFGEDRGRGDSAEAGMDLGKDVGSALVDISHQLPSERQAQNRGLDRQLEALRWTSFSDIP
jgi:hypothetical protein